jgi:hypothetical protein
MQLFRLHYHRIIVASEENKVKKLEQDQVRHFIASKQSKSLIKMY